MEDIDKKPEYAGWTAFAFGVFLSVCVIALANAADATVLAPTAVSSIVVTVMGALAVVRARFRRREAEERMHFEEHRASRESADLFEDADEAVRIAARANRSYVKYAIPVVTLMTGIAVVAASLLMWRSWNLAMEFPLASRPLRSAALVFSLFVACLIAGTYYLGASREEHSRYLRPPGAWIFFTAALLLFGGGVLLAQHFDVGGARLDPVAAKVATALLLVLGIEMLLNFVIEFYRPRTPDEEERPLYESRILALFTEPGGVARNVASALDYQFGFRVSEVWFYRFLERMLIPFAGLTLVLLWLLTSIVVIQPEENGIREAFGRVLTREALGPGLYFKLPWPFGKIQTFPVERVQEIPIGYSPGTEEGEMDLSPELQGDLSGRVIVWSKAHNKQEIPFVVASKSEQDRPFVDDLEAGADLPVTVYFLAASIPVYFKVDDLYKYRYTHADPLKTLEEIATREVVRYLAHVDFFHILTEGRREGVDVLSRRIQEAADRVDLGVNIVFVGLQGMHPPVEVGAAFNEVVAAMEEEHELVLEAERYAVQKAPAARADAVSIVKEAQGYKFDRIQVARAESNRFEKQLMAYDASPDVFLLRSFLDVLENEGAATRKYVVATSKGSEVIVVDLQKKLRPDLLDIDLAGEE